LNLEIPFPAIEVQQKIVDEILIEKAFIKGNKKLIRVYSEKKLDLLQKLWG
jgi:restriction endonuclease S subunit